MKLPVNVIVKLKPFDNSRQVYQKWIHKYQETSPVYLCQYEDLFEILTATDIAVSTASTSGLEAMGFGIPTIILNTIPDFDISESVSFIDDAMECKAGEEFLSTVNELIFNSQYYQDTLKEVSKKRSIYFNNFEGNSTSEKIRDYIVAEAGSLSQNTSVL